VDVCWNDDAVGDQIIDAIRGHGAGIAEETDLNRRGTQRDDRGSGMTRVAHPVHGDVDFELAQLSCNLKIACGIVGPMIEGARIA